MSMVVPRGQTQPQKALPRMRAETRMNSAGQKGVSRLRAEMEAVSAVNGERREKSSGGMGKSRG